MGLRRFIESEHPRGSDGKFRRKASVGVRVSTRSATVTVGKRYPIIPGKVNVYGGVLLRVERANAGNGIVDRLVDNAQSKLVSALPEGTLRNIGESLASGQSHREGSTLISASGIKPNTPTLRVTRSSKPSYTKNDADATPRRKRTPREPRTRSGGHSQTTNDPGYTSIVGQQQARAAAAPARRAPMTPAQLRPNDPAYSAKAAVPTTRRVK